MKAQVSTTEMILALMVLFLAFTILFPKFSYKTKWDDAYISLKGRDIVLTIDRINRIYNFSFNFQVFQDEFLNIISQQDVIINSNTEDAVKNQIFVACHCTNEQINYLQTQLADVRFNNRIVKVNYCYTNLDKINPCSTKITHPDVLIIWGYKDLSSYETTLNELLGKGNAIIEITDFDNSVDLDATKHKKIFGIDSGDSWPAVDYDTIPEPDNGVEIKYQPYKFFYHSPLPLKATDEGLRIGCTKNMTGNLKFWSTNYFFTICDSTTVHFDTNADGTLDSVPLTKGSSFNLQKITSPTGTYSFTLNYVQENEIDVSFESSYNFTDFCRFSSKKKIIPANNEINRAFLYAVADTNINAYCTILNGTAGKTAWVSDFSRSGLTSIGDDHRQLLLSLIVSLSNKKPKEQTDIGTITSYINVNNTDVFEIYKFNLGLKHPF